MSLRSAWTLMRNALAEERKRDVVRTRLTETAFHPAALEMVERPVSPVGRVTAAVLLVGLICTLLWLGFGKVDVVVSAAGEIIPAGNVKLIQAAKPGVVRAIRVRDGDAVIAGQPLIELDSTLSDADLSQARAALLDARIDAARNTAIVDGLTGGNARFAPPPGTPHDIADVQQRLVTARVDQITASTSSYQAARASALAEADGARAQVTKLDQTGAILGRELNNMRELDTKGYAPGLRLLELERQYRQEKGDKASAAAQLERSAADARKYGHQAQATIGEARQQALADLAKAQADVALRQEEVIKAEQKRASEHLSAPLAGTVQQLAVHTIGGVVEPAKPLMIIVPKPAGIEVEAKILNKDIGFVRTGDRISLKIEAFPFTHYGTISGRIRSISKDAVRDTENSKSSPRYIAHIVIDRNYILADGVRVPLTSGMAVVADIRTGSRSIMSYLLSPLQTTIEQAARER